MNLKQQYESVCKAIEEIESGAQSYKIGNREVTRANIMHLYRERENLAKAITRQQGDIRHQVYFDGR